jgi:hypothetical protein
MFFRSSLGSEMRSKARVSCFCRFHGSPWMAFYTLLEAIDLIVTKQLTDRPHDETDIRFLTNKIEAQYRARLRTCLEAEAVAMLDRFATPEIAAFAVRESKDDSIRAVGWRILHEMRANGDPFAEEFIREIGLASPEVIDRSQNEELLRRQKRTPEQDQELGQSL